MPFDPTQSDLEIEYFTKSLSGVNGNGKETKISISDRHIVNDRSLSLSRNGYVMIWTSKGIKYLHRFLMNAEPGAIVDHINGGALDNRRVNLRICTRTENARNRKKYSSSKYTYKGVYKNGNRFYAHIGLNGRKIRSRSFLSEIEAAREYDRLAKEYYGQYCKLNFE